MTKERTLKISIFFAREARRREPCVVDTYADRLLVPETNRRTEHRKASAHKKVNYGIILSKETAQFSSYTSFFFFIGQDPCAFFFSPAWLSAPALPPNSMAIPVPPWLIIWVLAAPRNHADYYARE